MAHSRACSALSPQRLLGDVGGRVFLAMLVGEGKWANDRRRSWVRQARDGLRVPARSEIGGSYLLREGWGRQEGRRKTVFERGAPLDDPSLDGPLDDTFRAADPIWRAAEGRWDLNKRSPHIKLGFWPMFVQIRPRSAVVLSEMALLCRIWGEHWPALHSLLWGI